jgi:hypothetical protein
VRNRYQSELGEMTLVILQITLTGFERHRAILLERLMLP